MPLAAPARLTIDLDALSRNFQLLSAEAAGAEVAPVVKADGYGLGAGPIARRLWAEGARSFFVARLAEGVALRAELGAARPARIFVLDGFSTGAGPALAAAELTPVLGSLAQIEAASAWAAGLGRRPPVALHLDTGMNREGLAPHEAAALAQGSDRLGRLDLVLVMSHLGCATEPENPRNREQLQRFAQVRALFPESRASLAASAGAFLGPDYRFDMVRPGVSLYGGGPTERPDPRLCAVATFAAPILAIRSVRPGEPIGYGLKVRAAAPMRLAILGAGYADGVLRAASGGGYGVLRGRRLPIRSVTMDLIAAELGDAEARVGEMVELLGPEALIDDLATAAGTVAHECLVRLGPRAQRAYVGAPG